LRSHIVVFLACLAGTCSAVHGQHLPVPPLLQVYQAHDFIDKGLLARSSALLRSTRVRSQADIGFERSQIDRAHIFRDRGLSQRAVEQHSTIYDAFQFSPFALSSALEAGFIELEANRLTEAIEYLERATSIGARDVAARSNTTYRDVTVLSHYWLGACYAQQKLYSKAIQQWGTCVVLSKSHHLAAQALFASAQVHELSGIDSLAASSYNALMKWFPLSALATEAQVRLAVIKLRDRNPVKALDELQGVDGRLQVHRSNEDSPRAAILSEYVHIIRLQAFTMLQQHQQALDSAFVFTQRYPASTNLSLVLLATGYAYLYLQRADSALYQYDRIIASDIAEDSEVRHQALLYRGVALQRLGRDAEAEQLFTALSVQAGYPYKPHALIEVGQALYVREDFERAQKLFEKAEREARDPAVTLKAQILLGSCQLQRQQWAKAADVFQRTISLAENTSIAAVAQKEELLATARLERGISLAQTNQLPAAIASLTDFLGNHPKDSRRDEATFWLAESMYRENLLKNAQEFYEEIVKRYTASLRREEAMYGLAWTHFRKRDFTKSSKAFEELITTYPQSRYVVEAMVRRADGLYINRQYRAAATQYEQASLNGGASEEGLYAGYQAGSAAYRDGDLDRATRLMRSFLQRYPQSRLSDDALYLIGWIAFQQQRDEDAIREFEALMQAYPDGDHAVRALYTIGDAQFNLGNYDLAMQTYRQVMSKYSSHPLATESAKSLQEVLVGQGRTDEAVAVLDTLIGLNPEASATEDFVWSKAQIFYSGKNYTTAAAELASYVKKYPSAGRKDEALYMLGKTYLSMNDLPQSLAAFRELEQSHASSEYVQTYRLDLAFYYASNANMSGADSIYQIIWKQHSDDTLAASTAGYEMAEHARMRGDTLAAVELFRTTADTYANSVNGTQARYKLAQLFRKMSNLDSARFHLQILAQRTDQPSIVANVLYDLGTTYFRERNYTQASEWFIRVREEYAGIEDWYTLSMLALGECYEQLQQKDQAIEAYSTIADLRPDDDYGKTAVARVKRLKGVRK